jgi:tryptophan 2,3-dioxygenase
MRRLRYHVATTVDRLIGHEDGSVDGKTYSSGVALLRYRIGAGQ